MSDVPYPALVDIRPRVSWQAAGYRPRSISTDVLVGLLRAVDVLLLVASAAAVTPAGLRHGTPAAGMYVAAGIAACATVAFGSGRAGLYRIASLGRLASQAGKWGVLLAAAAVAAAIVFRLLDAPLETVAWWPVGWAALAGVLVMGPRLLIAPAIQAGLAAGQVQRRVAVVGANTLGRTVARAILDDPHGGQSLVGVFDDDAGFAAPGVAGRVADLAALSRRERLDAIVIAHAAPAKIDLICGQLRAIVAEIHVATGIPATIGRHMPVSRLGDTALVTVIPRPLTDWEMVQKAVFDRLFGGVLLVVLSPLLLLMAAAIKLDSPGPVLFRQPRLGYNNMTFTLLKFRTMHHAMADLLADRQTSRDDVRVTRVGKMLRALSLDELPQLLNVLRGEMSIVGPRPHAPNTRAGGQRLHEAVAEYAERHRVKPGITGWAQVNGSRGELRTVEHVRQRVSYDLEYIQKWSLWFDIRIVLLTIRKEIFSRRAF
jgi:Undecaprenyl-phosphate glucose phosphotransferase